MRGPTTFFAGRSCARALDPALPTVGAHARHVEMRRLDPNLLAGTSVRGMHHEKPMARAGGEAVPVLTLSIHLAVHRPHGPPRRLADNISRNESRMPPCWACPGRNADRGQPEMPMR